MVSRLPEHSDTHEAHAHQIVMYSTPWCGDCRRAKRVFQMFSVPYAEIDIDEHPSAAQTVEALNGGRRSVPTIVFPDGAILVEPSNAELQAKLVPFIKASR